MPNLRSFLHFPQRLNFSKAVCTEDLVKIFKSLVATLATHCCRGDGGGMLVRGDQIYKPRLFMFKENTRLDTELPENSKKT